MYQRGHVLLINYDISSDETREELRKYLLGDDCRALELSESSYCIYVTSNAKAFYAILQSRFTFEENEDIVAVLTLTEPFDGQLSEIQRAWLSVNLVHSNR